MGKILAEILLAAFLGWVYWVPYSYCGGVETPEDVWEEDFQDEDMQEDGSQVEKRSRGVFSADVVGGVDCMDDGSYEQYVKERAEYPQIRQKPEPEYEPDEFPAVYLGFMGLDVTDYIKGEGAQQQYYYHKAFCSDQFYMEYPWDWYVGSTDACPLSFVPEWEEEASGEFIQDWAEYFDENLEGSLDQVQAYVEDGGINGFLEEAMGNPVTEDYVFELRERDSDWLLIYDLKKGEKEAAEIIIWCNLGKCNIRNWEVNLTVDPRKDYGRILVFKEWSIFDFSSKDTIMEYLDTKDFLYRLLGHALEENVEDQVISLEKGEHRSFYHKFVSVDVGIHDPDNPEVLLRQAWVYIPVTDSRQSNWVIVFESFPGSKEEEGVANRQLRERVISTFVALPYYHKVEKGENLSLIARHYGEELDLAYEIAAYQPGLIPNPDQIYPGQEIEIPLGVLFRKISYEE